MLRRIKNTLKRILPLPARTAGLYNSYIVNEIESIKHEVKELNNKLSELDGNIIIIQETASCSLSRIQQIETNYLRTQPQPRLSYFVLNILDHCNLKCQGCDHFANIAEERFVSAKAIDSDLRQMSLLTKGAVTRIGIMGGEPLLHPDLLNIMQSTRFAFTNTMLELVTNGILLMQQKNEFWEVCKDNNIHIVVTKYPLNLDFTGMEATAKENNVTLRYYGLTGETEKTTDKIPLDLNGRQNPVNSFRNCFHVNQCPLLMEGKLYPCTVSPTIAHFNKKFGTKMELEDRDYLDIYAVKNYSDISTFLSTPKPLCRFCRTTERTFGHTWARSKQEITEWL